MKYSPLEYMEISLSTDSFKVGSPRKAGRLLPRFLSNHCVIIPWMHPSHGQRWISSTFYPRATNSRGENMVEQSTSTWLKSKTWTLLVRTQSHGHTSPQGRLEHKIQLGSHDVATLRRGEWTLVDSQQSPHVILPSQDSISSSDLAQQSTVNQMSKMGCSKWGDPFNKPFAPIKVGTSDSFLVVFIAPLSLMLIESTNETFFCPFSIQ